MSIGSQYFVYCKNCPLSYSYFAQVYYFLFTAYFVFSLAFFRILLDVFVSVRRYCILVKKNWIGKYKLTVILILLAIISLGYYSKTLFEVNIYYNERLKRYSYKPMKSNYILDMIQNVIPMFFGVIVLSAINIANLIEYKRLYKFRENLLKAIKETELFASKDYTFK